MSLKSLARAAVAPWMLFWGAVALDSAIAYRRSNEAIERAISADPIEELYDGPPEQPGQIKRWLLWKPGALGDLRELRRRARAWMIGAPVAAIAGPPLLLALAQRLTRRPDDLPPPRR